MAIGRDLKNKDNFSLNRTLLVQNDNNFKEIIVSGRGKTEEKAAMNAAKNALFKKVWDSQKKFADTAVPFLSLIHI